MFSGEYNHTVDSKGRLIIPSKFREALGETFILTKGMDGCIAVYTQEEWSKFEAKLGKMPLTNKKARQLSRFFLAGATVCQIDSQGRVLLPATLREFAELEKDVIVVGVYERIEIWNKQKWTDYYDAISEEMEANPDDWDELGI